MRKRDVKQDKANKWKYNVAVLSNSRMLLQAPPHGYLLFMIHVRGPNHLIFVDLWPYKHVHYNENMDTFTIHIEGPIRSYEYDLLQFKGTCSDSWHAGFFNLCLCKKASLKQSNSKFGLVHCFTRTCRRRSRLQAALYPIAIQQQKICVQHCTVIHHFRSYFVNTISF